MTLGMGHVQKDEKFAAEGGRARRREGGYCGTSVDVPERGVTQASK